MSDKMMPKFIKISTNVCSFSAVSAPVFARKYAMFNIFLDLQDYLSWIFEVWFKNIEHVKVMFAKVPRFSRNFTNIADFSNRYFAKMFEFGAVRKCANIVAIEKCCQSHVYLQKSASIQPRTSPPKFNKNSFKIGKISDLPVKPRLSSAPRADDCRSRGVTWGDLDW